MTGMKSWSTTPANNVLANTGFTMDEGMAPSSVNDSVRALMADVRAEWAGGTDISASATPAIGASVGAYIKITGPNTITGFDVAAKGIRRRILVAGSPAPTFTHNAASLILPTGENILSVAGDTMTFVCESDISANWRCVEYSGNTVRTTQVGFPATQVPSTNNNVLDDYEEAIVATPALTFGGLSVGITYSGRTSQYIKIGRAVILKGQFILTSKGSSVGVAKVSLPLTSDSTIFQGTVAWKSMTSSFVNIIIEADNGLLTASLLGAGAAATSNRTALADTDFSNTSEIYYTLSYMTAS